uniref:vitamin-K-epoxide reductase (warfarin-sensitive) n=1 Tax=Strigamia maritima TaxID=126957 RepID=T1J6K7_STRMM
MESDARRRSEKIARLHIWITFCCMLGLSLSFYAYYVEVQKTRNKKYTAFCDISEHVSCSKVFNSKYGTGFGILDKILGKNSLFNQPNGIYGMLFYLIFPIIAYYDSLVILQIGIALFSNLMSIYLAAILYFVLYDFCVVCISTYVINAIITALSFKKLSILKSNVPKKVK